MAEAVEKTLVWRGSLTRKKTVELRKELLDVFLHDGVDRLTINLAEVEAFDSSCLLLLCAAKRHAVCKGQSVVLEGADNPAVVATVNRYGLGEERYCLPLCGGVCLWAKVESKQQIQADQCRWI